MNLSYLLERKHIFKNRRIKSNKRKFKFKIGNSAFFSLKIQRFELVYLRGFKKIIRRRCIKIKSLFKRRKIWFFLRPNCILSSKSVNARMGAGVGSLVRICVWLKSYKSFVEFQNYSFKWCRRLNSIFRFRYPLRFVYVTK